MMEFIAVIKEEKNVRLLFFECVFKRISFFKAVNVFPS